MLFDLPAQTCIKLGALSSVCDYFVSLMTQTRIFLLSTYSTHTVNNLFGKKKKGRKRTTKNIPYFNNTFHNYWIRFVSQRPNILITAPTASV